MVLGLVILAFMLAIPAASATQEINGVVVVTATEASAIQLTDFQEIPANSTEAGVLINRAYVIDGPFNEASTFYTSRMTSATDAVYSVHVVSVQKGVDLPVNYKTFSLTPSRSTFYKETVADGTRHKWLDLNWNNPLESLSVTAYPPDAVLGPYTDNSDGKRDGRIFLDIGSETNVTPGNWYYMVQNSRPDPTDYTLNTYAS
jgi:hypothetical protein